MIMPDTGSGYGGKHTGDAALEAARLAKAAGKPVKRNWTREEEMTWAYFRPGGVIEVGGEGRPRRHHHRVGVPQLQLGTVGAAIAVRDRRARRSSSTRRNRRCGRGRTAAWRRRPTISCANPTWMSWRNRSSMDPLEFRLKNAKNERLRNVIRGGGRTSSAGRTRKKTAGRGFGIAAGFEKGGYVATCAEVSVTERRGEGGARGGGVRVRRGGESRAPAQPGGGRGRHGAGRRAVRADRVRRQQDSQPTGCRATACRGSRTCR